MNGSISLIRKLFDSALKNRSRLTFGFVLMFAVLWIIFAFGYENADYGNYLRAYENVTELEGARFESGYAALQLVAKQAGISQYETFLPFFSLLGLFILAESAMKYGGKYALLILLSYAFYPFSYDVIQVRNFLAEVIVIFSIRYLKNFDAKNFIMFSIFLFLAVLVHRTSLFYLLFAVAYINNTKKVFALSALAALGLFIIMPFVGNIINALFPADAEAYGTFIIYPRRSVGYFSFALIMVAVCLFFDKRKPFILKLQSVFGAKLVSPHSPIQYRSALLRVCMIMLVVPAFMIIDFQFQRFFRTLIVVFSCTVANGVCGDKRLRPFLFVSAFVSIFFFFNRISPTAGNGGHIVEIISNNYFFDLILSRWR